MTDFVPVPLVWIRSIAGVLALAVVGVFFVGRCSAPDPAPLPAKVQAQLDRHRVATAVDTAEVNRLARDRAAAKTREQDAAVVRVELEEAAAVERHRADSLATIAAAAVTSADSSSWAWRSAYEARTFEVTTLRRALDSAKSETAHADVAGEKSDTISAVDLRRAARADSMITTLVDVATHGDQCRIAWVLHCPTRRQVFVGGVLAGAAGALIATGKIKIPIALPRF